MTKNTTSGRFKAEEPLFKVDMLFTGLVCSSVTRGRIFSHVRPSYEQAVSDLDRSMNISLWV
jgi:hypothetical protein